jgi:hypothetical protein
MFTLTVAPAPPCPRPLSATQQHTRVHPPGLSSLKLERSPLLSAFHEAMRSLMVLKNWPLNHHFLIVHLLRSLPEQG